MLHRGIFMRIGIITFHRAINYGAVLQTYALQKFLNVSNYDAEVIDYRCEHMENFYKTFTIKDKSIKQIIRGMLNLKNTYKKKREFYRFLNQNVRISTEVYDKFNIDKANLRYDKFITGSDQVFNFACTDFDKTYFLQFVKNCDNKLSYAASFGMKEIPDGYVNDYKSLLSTFSELSIRENAGQQIVKKLTGKDSELSVDPVFLLTAEEWEKLAKKPKLKNYILIYKLNTSNLIFDFARKLSKLTGRKIVALNFDVVDQMKTPDIKGVYSASVEEFLGYIKYADYVVTNSFHGTAFSVIFHKDFYVEALQKDFKPNDRAESLLCLTGLDECKVKTLEDCRLIVSRDFNFADDQIRKQYIKTKQYFERVLNEDGRSF